MKFFAFSRSGCVRTYTVTEDFFDEIEAVITSLDPTRSNPETEIARQIIAKAKKAGSREGMAKKLKVEHEETVSKKPEKEIKHVISNNADFETLKKYDKLDEQDKNKQLDIEILDTGNKLDKNNDDKEVEEFCDEEVWNMKQGNTVMVHVDARYHTRRVEVKKVEDVKTEARPNITPMCATRTNNSVTGRSDFQIGILTKGPDLDSIGK